MQECVPVVYGRENIIASQVIPVQQQDGGEWSRSNKVHAYPATSSSGSSTSRTALPEKVLYPLVNEENTQVPVMAEQLTMKTAPYSLNTSMQKKLKHSDDERGPVRAACDGDECVDGGGSCSGGSRPPRRRTQQQR